jgi:FkbM family methyltransferase
VIYETREEVEAIGRAGVKVSVEDRTLWSRQLSSFWLALDPNDVGFTPHAKWEGYWEAWITAWLSQQLDHHTLFVDVGANVGYYTMLAANHGVRTIAIEPNSRVADLLEISLLRNRLRDKVEVLQCALSDFDGRATLWVPPDHPGGATIEGTTEGLEVEVYTMDRGLIRNRWDKVLIKIDAEGSEPKIWRGMQGYLSKGDWTVVLEWMDGRFDKAAFVDELFKHDVTLVNFSGREESITREWLLNTPDLHMICVRPKEKA